ncbi:MAG: LuxR C-terminal-related transcriptional regulator [Cyanobacteriota bacterium]|nr:LuxR C-terminal-related transcriptional regulator [Cyanobacteriota bacterium]
MNDLMAPPLQELIQAIALARNEAELQAMMGKVGVYFAAKRSSLWFFDRLPKVDRTTPEMVKRALSLDENPILRYVVQRHAALHDETILPRGVWKTICPRADHGHVMAGPLIRNGQLVGGIGLTRHRDDPPFNAENLTDLSALCLHISAQLARFEPVTSTLNCDRLTPREAQIAELVARGLTNKEIGAMLWITENSVKQALKRMFRKLEVSSRAQMVAQLLARSIAPPSDDTAA